MKKSLFFASLLIIVLFSSCKYGFYEAFYRDNPVEKRSKEIQKISLVDAAGQNINLAGKDSFSFIIISDVHFGQKKEYIDKEFISAVKKLAVKPDFCICLGDIAEHGLKSEYTKFDDSVVKELEALGIKTYNVVGNHDLYNSGWENYKNFCYPYSSFYYFQSGDYSFYFLDTASGLLSEPQMTSFKKTIKKDSNKKFVFSHFSLYSENSLYFVIQDVEERNELLSVLAKNDVIAYFGGHIHADRQSDFGSFDEISVPAFLEQRTWGLCTVNTTTSEYKYEKFTVPYN